MMNGNESALLEYAKNPANKGVLDVYTISHHESNRSCGDSLTIYLLLSDDLQTIQGYSFDGDTSIVTTAFASLFGEVVVGMTIQKLLSCTYSDLVDLLGIEVTPKRKLAATLALLATRNAVHVFQKDGIVDDFSDVLE